MDFEFYQFLPEEDFTNVKAFASKYLFNPWNNVLVWTDNFKDDICEEKFKN